MAWFNLHLLEKYRALPLALLFIAFLSPHVNGQAPAPATSDAMLSLPGDLPDAPSSINTPADDTASSDPIDPAPDHHRLAFDPSTIPRTVPAARFSMTILPNQIPSSPMKPRDKFLGGLKDATSPFAITGWVTAAGWEQMTNGSPNYGTDSGAFGQRLGAAAIRGISENFFSKSVFAPIFHEDPRYYEMGNGRGFFKRAFYAGTRCIVTRTDAGNAAPNFALLIGNAAAAALTKAYYPSQNTTFSQVSETYATSIGGAALGYVAREFLDDTLEFVHLKRLED
jgi:hypothetical protein